MFISHRDNETALISIALWKVLSKNSKKSANVITNGERCIWGKKVADNIKT